MRNDSPFHQIQFRPAPTRREFLWQSGGGLGGVALASLLDNEARAEVTKRTLQFPQKAKRVIHLFMAGAASHIDLWDYKPE
jgi:hypothetical protein